jgi:hypothetical protein
MSRVYFVQVGEGLRGPIKIGTAIRVASRIAGMQSGNHQELRLLFDVPFANNRIDGAYAAEASLHRYFAGQRIRSEWFSWSEDLASVIERLREVVPQIHTVDRGAELFHVTRAGARLSVRSAIYESNALLISLAEATR